MAEQNIKCPYCNRTIQLTEALSNDIREGVKAEFEGKAKERELEFKKREEELLRRLSLEKAKLIEEARKRAAEDVDIELKDLREAAARKDRLIEEAKRHELELRRRSRELEDEKKSMDLELARKLDAERERIRQTTLEVFSEEHRLKDLEKDKKISDMQRLLDEAKRKGEQGSMQTQGEVLELGLEALLREKFPLDVIEPVAKGIKGADIVQKVYTRTNVFCGSIAWESKRTKAWSDEWITKLKDDQREIKAEAAVIVTETMPKGVTAFAQVDGVWVTSVALAGCLAEVLRAALVQVAHSRLSAVGKNEKMEAIYNYLSGSGFRQRVEAIVESFMSMKDDLDAEKRAAIKTWAKREKQIERVMTNTSGMYGDLQGIIGSTLPEIKALEPGGKEDEDNDLFGKG